MHEYALIMLDVLAYARILNVSDAVHSIRSLYKLLSSYCRQRRTQNTFKHLRWRVLQKKNVSADEQPAMFQSK